MKPLTEKDLVLHLAGVHGLKKLSVLASSYQADNLQKALKDRKGKQIDLIWYVNELLKLHDDPLCKDRVSILDRLRELIFLGAIQDPIILAKIQEATMPLPKNVKMSDPFDLKVRKVV